jgi:Mg2+/Co2+ transporter CorB
LIDIPLGALFGALIVCLFISAFFSASETAMMALNRYRLRHLANSNHPGAIRANTLLQRPDRLIGLILIGNNFVNIVASSIATLIGLELYGEAGIAVAAAVLTLVMLVVSEVGPKTVAALYPERIAFPSSRILAPLLILTYPIVWMINYLTNALLNLLRLTTEEKSGMALSREELRTVVKEAGALIPQRHQQMLFGILDLEKATVEDIMVPRNEIFGIDLDDDINLIGERLSNCLHTRIAVYRGSIDNLHGILHARQIHRVVTDSGDVDLTELENNLVEPYFVPIGTPLHTQLENFQRLKKRISLIVDEYGEIQGLVTLEDILEEIVGKFTTDPLVLSKDIYQEENGAYIIDGSALLREINRNLRWRLPIDGPKTLNGLILEALESIPEPGVSLRIKNYTVEILQMSGQVVKVARITPPPRTRSNAVEKTGNAAPTPAKRSAR